MAKKVLAALGAPAAMAAGALGGVYAFVFAPGTSGREDSLPPEVRSRRPELQRKHDFQRSSSARPANLNTPRPHDYA